MSGGRECVDTAAMPVAGMHTGRVPSTRAPVEVVQFPRIAGKSDKAAGMMYDITRVANYDAKCGKL